MNHPAFATNGPVDDRKRARELRGAVCEAAGGKSWAPVEVIPGNVAPVVLPGPIGKVRVGYDWVTEFAASRARNETDEFILRSQAGGDPIADEVADLIGAQQAADELCEKLAER